MTEQVRISQRSAIIIERLRSEGIAEDILIQALSEQADAPLRAVSSVDIDFAEWMNYANEHGEQLVQAVRDGYRMTFTTVPGMKNWLKYALSMEASRDYIEAEEGRMDGLQLTLEQAQQLKDTIAVNWVLLEHEDGSASLLLRALLTSAEAPQL
ncbi:hypothetical protein [Paenibacillus bovis]|uniref:Uncharacterized protein n=1 Tax=Paenibacillus bovis TaxID=1616788 RepID=A0A172ZKL7_9BACL|nr:hypothetical protein [Paenibacillus bovis]ANF98083.1 hypothetical protein AR543_20090 [Paenibacillus bovis]